MIFCEKYFTFPLTLIISYIANAIIVLHGISFVTILFNGKHNYTLLTKLFVSFSFRELENVFAL